MDRFLPYINIAILLATIVAIIAGPILAVRVTRRHDDEKWRRDRRISVLRDLMRTRGIRLDPVHVAALNVIELEFYGEKSVMAAYRAYIRHLSSPLPMPDQQDRYFEERFEMFLDLIQELAKSLGISFDRGDITRLAYSPIAWEQDHQMQRRNMALLAEFLEGRRPISVTNFASQVKKPMKSLFPPAPDDD